MIELTKIIGLPDWCLDAYFVTAYQLSNIVTYNRNVVGIKAYFHRADVFFMICRDFRIDGSRYLFYATDRAYWDNFEFWLEKEGFLKECTRIDWRKAGF